MTNEIKTVLVPFPAGKNKFADCPDMPFVTVEQNGKEPEDLTEEQAWMSIAENMLMQSWDEQTTYETVEEIEEEMGFAIGGLWVIEEETHEKIIDAYCEASDSSNDLTIVIRHLMDKFAIQKIIF